MKIYTSYFGNLKNIPKDIVPISIARYTPKWYKGFRFEKFMPSGELLRGYKTGVYDEEDYYNKYFKDVLKGLDPEKIYRELSTISDDHDIVLLSYEKNSFCHMRIVSEWWNHYGYSCVEIRNDGTSGKIPKQVYFGKEFYDGAKR